MQVNENPNKVPVELNRTSLYLGLFQLNLIVLAFIWAYYQFLYWEFYFPVTFSIKLKL